MQWSSEEIKKWKNDDASSSLLKQVRAVRTQYEIIKKRITFKGYQYEYKGEKCEKGETYSLPNITVNEIKYDSIEDAVLNLSKQLNINSNKFYEQLSRGTSFQDTYNFLERDKTVELEIRRLAKKNPKKNKKFIKSAITRISNQYKDFSLYEAIEYLEVNYLMTQKGKDEYKKNGIITNILDAFE